MSAVFGRRKRRLSVLSATLLASVVFGGAAAQADTVTVSIDKARVMRLPEGVATIVIGNPLIADASLQRGGILVVTGKGYGSTNLLALDRDGHIVLDKTVRVQGPAPAAIWWWSTVASSANPIAARRSASRRITLGDGTKYFTDTLEQSAARSGKAQPGGGGRPRRADAGLQVPAGLVSRRLI